MDTVIIILAVAICVALLVIGYVFYSWWTDRSSAALEDVLTESVHPRYLKGALATLKGDNPDFGEAKIGV